MYAHIMENKFLNALRFILCFLLCVLMNVNLYIARIIGVSSNGTDCKVLFVWMALDFLIKKLSLNIVKEKHLRENISLKIINQIFLIKMNHYQ